MLNKYSLIHSLVFINTFLSYSWITYSFFNQLPLILTNATMYTYYVILFRFQPYNYNLIQHMSFPDKLLGELIRPTDTRIADVRDFLEDVKPGLEYNVVAITDPYGPTLEDASIQCLVVSEETSRGGELINVKRKERVEYD